MTQPAIRALIATGEARVFIPGKGYATVVLCYVNQSEPSDSARHLCRAGKQLREAALAAGEVAETPTPTFTGKNVTLPCGCHFDAEMRFWRSPYCTNDHGLSAASLSPAVPTPAHVTLDELLVLHKAYQVALTTNDRETIHTASEAIWTWVRDAYGHT